MIQIPVCQLQEALKKALLSVMAEIPSLSATVSESPKNRTFTTKNHYPPRKKILLKKKDTLNLYKINNYYYFRKRINKNYTGLV